MVSSSLARTLFLGLLVASLPLRVSAQTPQSISQHRGLNATGEEVVVELPNGPADGGYGIKQEDPDVGHNILRRVVTGSALPFDKTWNELTGEQQALVKARYEKLPADQEPPFPTEGLASVYKPVRDLIATYTHSGTPLTVGKMALGISVGPSGLPENVTLYEASDKDFATALAQALMNVHFKPGRCGGKACQMEFPVDMELVHRY